MNTDVGWGVLIGAVGLLGLEALGVITVAVVSARRRVTVAQPQPGSMTFAVTAKTPQSKPPQPPNLRVIDGEG
jgi:hypothetical protein